MWIIESPDHFIFGPFHSPGTAHVWASLLFGEDNAWKLRDVYPVKDAEQIYGREETSR